ncbi:MAG: hypothetical protein JWM19_861 [Actinomycetia bacterium]|nr:hypothetical protein [Actinomycetes bacterium]
MPTLTSGMAEFAAEGCLVKPLFYNFIMDPKATALNLLVERPVQREPDGWFHASQHPLAGEKDLYLWMTGQLPPEQMGYVSLMSVMFGSLLHAPVEAFLDWMGASVPLPPGECPACGRQRRPLRARPSSKYCTEHGFAHLATRARCHLDAILKFGDELYGFDFKSIYIYGFAKTKDRAAIRDMDAGQFRERWPGYWAQMQECMRLSGLRKYIVMFLTMGNPWDTREFHFDFDPQFAADTEEKYRYVLDRVRREEPILI